MISQRHELTVPSTSGNRTMSLTPAKIRQYDEQAPDGEGNETATFALGCFWGPDAEFGAKEGVVRTRVGYAGGTKQDPSYHSLGDHTEAFQVEYDPTEATFVDLIEDVFRSHDPRRQTRKTQYQNIVFTADGSQSDAVDEFLKSKGMEPDGIGTRIEELEGFHPAEDYHQKYSLRSHQGFMDAFEEAGYDDEALRESPAAAKLNGYAAGNQIPSSDELGVSGTKRE